MATRMDPPHLQPWPCPQSKTLLHFPRSFSRHSSLPGAPIQKKAGRCCKGPCLALSFSKSSSRLRLGLLALTCLPPHCVDRVRTLVRINPGGRQDRGWQPSNPPRGNCNVWPQTPEPHLPPSSDRGPRSALLRFKTVPSGVLPPAVAHENWWR
jgi:hypothetical protein